MRSLPVTTSLSPRRFDLLNCTCTFGRRISASIIITFFPLWASTMARFAATVDLPSDSPELVTSMILAGSSTDEYSRLVRKDRKASATGERGFFATKTPSESSPCLGLFLSSPMNPITGVSRRSLISSGVLRVSSKNSTRKANPAVTNRPIAAASKALCTGLGDIGVVGLLAVSTCITVGVDCAFESRRVSRLLMLLM